MTFDDLANLDAVAQAQLARDKKVSKRELVEAAIDRIERVNPALNAVIHERFERALDESEHAIGPFGGVPIVIKDLECHTAGDPFHCGMQLLKGMSWTEPNDALVAALLRRAGYVVVGRTNTPELGMMATTEPEAYGPTRNPWDVERSPGGSSGGSAAAVAARMIPVGHATDSGGSIRIPSSACGLVGLKPSRGRVPGVPVGDLAGANVEHVVTRSVRDSASTLVVFAGTGWGAPDDEPPVRLRVGLMTTAPGGLLPVHPDCVAAVKDAAQLIASLGHTVEDAHPGALDELEHVMHYGAVTGVEVVTKLGHWSSRTGRPIWPGDVESHTWMLAEMGRSVTKAQLRTSLRYLAGYSRRVIEWWESGYDLLLTPTLAEPPPLLGELASTRDEPFKAAWRAAAIVPFTPPFNTTGQPAIALPLHWSEAGLPIGVQLVAAPGREDVLFKIAYQLEEARPWADRRPPVCA